jgi:hypothetical protein
MIRLTVYARGSRGFRLLVDMHLNPISGDCRRDINRFCGGRNDTLRTGALPTGRTIDREVKGLVKKKRLGLRIAPSMNPSRRFVFGNQRCTIAGADG